MRRSVGFAAQTGTSCKPIGIVDTAQEMRGRVTAEAVLSGRSGKDSVPQVGHDCDRKIALALLFLPNSSA